MKAEARSIDGPAGRLDSRWHGPADGPPVLISHPHPLHGGSMGTRLVYELARALASDGLRAVRFDHRGVGRSQGTYDMGIGEVEDAEAVRTILAEVTGRSPMLIGFSFGGAVCLRLAGAYADTPSLVCIATPATVRDSRLRPVEDAGRVTCPVNLVYGSRDELVSRADAEALAASLPKPPRWHVLEGADHFLTPTHVPRAVGAVRAAIAPALL